ncbi:MAG TPA: hypothetical protein VIA81_03775 [Acidimicrobiia bacterium]
MPVATHGELISEIRDRLWGQRFETAAAVAVSEESRLVGLIRMEDLIGAPADVLASDVMDRDPAVVRPGVDQEKAAWHAVGGARRPWQL